MKKQFILFIIILSLINSVDANHHPLENNQATAENKVCDTAVNIEIVSDEKTNALNRLAIDKSDTKELELVFKYSPIDAQNIVEQLKKINDCKKPFCNYVIFVGLPGTGKTTMAKAIAYKLVVESGWSAYFISSGDLIGKYRNQTLENLKSYLDTIAAQNKKAIVIIDELNELLENAHDSHYDTSATAKYLWQFLDKHQNNKNLFVIGTMNRDTELPLPIKSRICQRRIKFDSFSDEQIKFDIFLHKISDAHIRFDKNVSKDYIQDQIKNLTESTGRDFKEFAFLLERVYKRYNLKSEEIVITKEIFDETLKEYKKNRQEIEYDKVFETEEERQERHFMQSKFIERIMRLSETTNYEYDGWGSDRKVCATWQTISNNTLAGLNAIFVGKQRTLLEKFIEQYSEGIEQKRKEEQKKEKEKEEQKKVKEQQEKQKQKEEQENKNKNRRWYRLFF